MLGEAADPAGKLVRGAGVGVGVGHGLQPQEARSRRAAGENGLRLGMSSRYFFVPLPSIAFEPVPIWILRGLCSSGFGTRISRTPLS
jgi:hypothetical protein